MRTSSSLLAVVVIACAGSLAGCSEKSPSSLSSPTSPSVSEKLSQEGFTYRIPEPVPEGPRGTVLSTKHDGPSPGLADADRYTIVYRTADRDGKDTVSSGVVLIPEGKAPDEGWPVISWAHGTVGVADQCAPSHSDNLSYDVYAHEVTELLKAGYAVVATDYIGLGTPGPHLYMQRNEQGNAVADIVSAARHIAPSLGATWFAVGHSQGGAAALESSASGSPAAVVAVAPGGGLDKLSGVLAAGGLEANPRLPLYLMFLLVSLSEEDSSVQLSELLSPEGLDAAQHVRDGACLSDPSSVPALSADMFRLDALSQAGIFEKLALYGNPDRNDVKGPLFVITGENDTDVSPLLSSAVIEGLRRDGTDVSLISIPDADHDQALQWSLCPQLRFLEQHGGNTPSPEACSSH